MRIVIVDDDPLVVSSLKMILEAGGEVEAAAVGSDGSDAIRLYELEQPDILLTDIRMKDVSGLEAAETILKKHPDARILLLTTFSDDEYIVRALRSGVKGYLLKQDYQSILPALRAVMSGQTVFGSEVIGKLPSLMQKRAAFDYAAHEITERERELIALVAEGLSNREISEKMFLSEGTVRNYLSTILEKLQLRDRTQLAVFWLNHQPE